MPWQLDGLSTADYAPEVCLQLGRILRSSHFSRSPQAANLLSFLVNQTLSLSPGETSGQLKEYSIAVQVFGRPASFDSSADNIVRVEVRRVRAKLERYYEDEGASDPIGISIPKGTYVPVFRKRHYAEFDSSGRTISHYELGRRRCVNRWQSAYDAKCLHLHRFVTVILPTRLTMEDEGRRQSLLEKMRAGVVDHPGVAAVHDVEATQERVIIAAAALPGRSLREYVEGSRLAGDPAVGFARELANALASGHSLGMLHGNLNPDSLSINEGASGEAPHAHLMPFGMLPLVDIEHASFEGFRPPEWSVGGEPDLRSDVWSFGALVWFACYGVAPPPVPSAAGEGAEGGSMPPQLAGVLARCLQPEPGLRYASAVEIAEEMGPVSAAPVVPREEAPPAKPRWARHKVIVLTAISLVAVVATIIVSAHFRSKPPAGSEPRLIVLPLENTNADPENEPYCRAAADLLAARLARLPGVQVVSSLSVDRRKRDQFSAEFLQTKLHVDYAVEGTLLRLGPEFQATVQLLDVGAGRHVWSDSYGGPWTDVSARIEELADKAAQSMGLVVQREQIQPASSPAINVMAHDAWLKGRFSAIEYWNTLLPGHFDDAERRLRRALELHPSYVNAMVDLGQLYLSGAYAHSLGQRGVEPSKGSQADLYDKAEEFAASAVAVDPESGPAHAVLGSVYTDTGRLRMAMPHLLRALRLSPHDPNAHNYMCIAYEAMGFWESSLFEREQAIERDPLLQGIQSGGSQLRVRLGRIAQERRVLESLEPGSQEWGLRTARLHLLTGDPKRAEQVLLQTRPKEPPEQDSFDAMLALAKAEQGDREIAKRAVKKFATPERSRTEVFVLLCALAGEKKLLVNQIEKHSYIRNYRWLVSEPLVQPYRTDPAFQKLVHALYEEWLYNLREFGPTLPVQPPQLPSAEQYLSRR